MTSRITIRKPDDWHLHVRDGAMLKAVHAVHGQAFRPRHPDAQSHSAGRHHARTPSPIASASWRRCRPGSTFKPLMTCYLTDDTDPDDVERGFKEGVFTGVKLYPANATTNSAAGVTDYRKIMPRAGAHGKDRHAVPDARRGRRSR